MTRIRKITRLQNRFLFCYILTIFLPIALLSSIIYYYNISQRRKEYISDQKNSLIIEQNYLENQLDSAQNYFNQLESNYTLTSLLRGFCTSEREIVYAYNSQIYSLLSSITLYDENLDSITIYTNDADIVRILKPFDSLESLSLSEDFLSELRTGLWYTDEAEDSSVTFSYYVGFSNPPMTVFSGITRLKYNSTLFDSYTESNPESSVFIYLKGNLIYQAQESEATVQYLSEQEQEFLAMADETPQVIWDNRKHMAVSVFSLAENAFQVIKITPEKDSLFLYRPFLLNLVVTILILCCASVIIFWMIFKPFRNIVRLSEHMKKQNNHTLTHYEGKISNDEVGELIFTFNQLADRINHLSSQLLNNEIQLKNAQIEALQAQLNPHFFYGTLESIHMIAEANHQDLIAEISFSFGNLMRYSLSREYLVPVNQEIDITRQYLSIQEKRLLNRFDTSWDLCELDEKWRCPKFILYSMVENVFSHNVSKCRTFIHITISIHMEKDDLLITVTNTGPGVSPERLGQLHRLLAHPEERRSMTSEKNGCSIFNIDDRLKIFYGDEYHFSIESAENEWTVCSVKIHKYFKNNGR